MRYRIYKTLQEIAREQGAFDPKPTDPCTSEQSRPLVWYVMGIATGINIGTILFIFVFPWLLGPESTRYPVVYPAISRDSEESVGYWHTYPGEPEFNWGTDLHFEHKTTCWALPPTASLYEDWEAGDPIRSHGVYNHTTYYYKRIAM